MANLTSEQLNAALRGLLNEEIKRGKRTIRGIEKQLQWGHGTLSNVLSGRYEIRLRHIEAVAHLLGLTLEALLLQALGYTARRPPKQAAPTLDDRFAQVVANKVLAALAPDDCACSRNTEAITPRKPIPR